MKMEQVDNKIKPLHAWYYSCTHNYDFVFVFVFDVSVFWK